MINNLNNLILNPGVILDHELSFINLQLQLYLSNPRYLYIQQIQIIFYGREAFIVLYNINNPEN